MKPKKIILRLAALISILILLPALSFAMRPYLETDDAIPVERGNTKLEAGILTGRTVNDIRSNVLQNGITFGMINNLDFELELPYYIVETNRGENGVGDLYVKLKLIFLKGRQANMLSIAGMLIGKFPFCNEDKNLSEDCTGEPDQGFKFIATRMFQPEDWYPVTVHLNLGKIFVGSSSNVRLKDVFLYSLGFNFDTPYKTLDGIFEFSGRSSRFSEKDYQYILAGVRADIAKNLLLDGGLAIGASRLSNDYNLTAGITYNF